MLCRSGSVSNKLCIICDTTCHTLIDSPHSTAKTPWCVTFNVFHLLSGCSALHCTALHCGHTGLHSHMRAHAKKVQIQCGWRRFQRKLSFLTFRYICIKHDSRCQRVEQKCPAAPQSILASFLHQSPVCQTAAKTVLGLDKTHQSGDSVPAQRILLDIIHHCHSVITLFKHCRAIRQRRALF